MSDRITVGHIQLQADIDRIQRAARVAIQSQHDRARRTHRVTVASQADADAFRTAAEAIGLADEISD